MDGNEALDREVLVERAERLRGWLETLALSNEAMSALSQELDEIIANDPGGYINGQRPLAGLTIDTFIAELQSPGSGAIARVKNVGTSVLSELLAAISPEGKSESVEHMDTTAPIDQPEAPVKRGPGRPKGSTNAARNAASTPGADAPVKRGPGRPRKSESTATPALPDAPRRGPGRPRKSESTASPARAPRVAAKSDKLYPASTRQEAPSAVSTALAHTPDPALKQIVQLWPSLHPAARRAIVLYASNLLAEGNYEV